MTSWIDVTTTTSRGNNSITENAPKGHFQGSLLLLWIVPNTALTAVWTINVSIDCNWFQVPNPNKRKTILD